jgi:hypothetical protein
MGKGREFSTLGATIEIIDYLDIVLYISADVRAMGHAAMMVAPQMHYIRECRAYMNF